ncbi:MAG TPA: response regulator [Pyrinomonadaceae bacterium]|nr:response regulator [Pyrinomonadaceae bacterium]
MARILVVDDDDTIRDTLHELLSEDYECDTAETAEIAVGKLDNGKYELVLTDISMPGLSGVDLLKLIREKYSDTPVILISGIGDQERAESLIKLGAFDFITKPFSLETVEQGVRRAVESAERQKRGEAES